MLPKKVVLVDCRNVVGDEDALVEHSYFVRSSAVCADIGSVLAGLEAETIGNRKYITATRAWRVVAELTPGG